MGDKSPLNLGPALENYILKLTHARKKLSEEHCREENAALLEFLISVGGAVKKFSATEQQLHTHKYDKEKPFAESQKRAAAEVECERMRANLLNDMCNTTVELLRSALATSDKALAIYKSQMRSGDAEKARHFKQRADELLEFHHELSDIALDLVPLARSSTQHIEEKYLPEKGK